MRIPSRSEMYPEHVLSGRPAKSDISFSLSLPEAIARTIDTYSSVLPSSEPMRARTALPKGRPSAKKVLSTTSLNVLPRNWRWSPGIPPNTMYILIWSLSSMPGWRRHVSWKVRGFTSRLILNLLYSGFPLFSMMSSIDDICEPQMIMWDLVLVRMWSANLCTVVSA